MNSLTKTLALACFLLFAFGLFFFFSPRTDLVPENRDRLAPRSAAQEGEASLQAEGGIDGEGVPAASSRGDAPVAPVVHSKDIQEIKKQLYDLNIEFVEDIPKLDRIVQTGGAPTKAFWTGGWSSVDDFKEEANGFKLEPQADGTYIFYPDENTTKTYTFFETPKTYQYDPDKREFFWEIDYYGKTISHRARFINDNVVAMMLISGRKVTLDLYQKQPVEAN